MDRIKDRDRNRDKKTSNSRSTSRDKLKLDNDINSKDNGNASPTEKRDRNGEDSDKDREEPIKRNSTIKYVVNFIFQLIQISVLLSYFVARITNDVFFEHNALKVLKYHI